MPIIGIASPVDGIFFSIKRPACARRISAGKKTDTPTHMPTLSSSRRLKLMDFTSELASTSVRVTSPKSSFKMGRVSYGRSRLGATTLFVSVLRVARYKNARCHFGIAERRQLVICKEKKVAVLGAEEV